VGNLKGVHGQFRHGRITSRGTASARAHGYEEGLRVRREWKGSAFVAAPNPWGVTPFKERNILVVDRPSIREVTPQGETVATITPTVDAPITR